MADVRNFPLHPFPRTLMRKLITFAAAGTLMAFVVWSDGEWSVAIPIALLVFSWLTPALFAYQIKTQGFDPLERFEAAETNLVAHYRDGQARSVPWTSMQRLVEVIGFRHRAWAILSDQEPIRWFGELEAPEDFAREVSERTGLSWEVLTSMPETPAAS